MVTSTYYRSFISSKSILFFKNLITVFFFFLQNIKYLFKYIQKEEDKKKKQAKTIQATILHDITFCAVKKDLDFSI